MATSTSRGRRPTHASTYRRLDHLVQAQPQQAIVEAIQLLQSSPDDSEVVLHGWATVGRALYELGDMPRASDAMRHALRSSEWVEADDRLVQVRMSAAVVFAESGQLTDALHQLAHAEQMSTGAMRGRVRTQTAFVLCHAGRLVEALDRANLAEDDLRRTGDKLGLLRLMVNRSLINLQRGELTAAEAELMRAHRLAERLDQSLTAALIVANLGVVHGRAGRTILALAHFDRAREQYIAAGKPLRTMTILETDRAETLLRAGLYGDAIAAARLAVAYARATGNEVSIGDAELLLAQAELAGGSLAAATRAASSAAQLLYRGARRGVSLQARAVGLQASLGAVVETSAAMTLLARARRMAARLDRYGSAEIADDLRCARLRCASRFDVMDQADDDVQTMRKAVRSPRPSVAVRGWFAETLAQWHGGDAQAAMQSARRGMNLLERHRQTTVDFEQRVGLSAIGADLGAVAMRIAVESRKPGSIFVWAERTRANAFPLAAVSSNSAPTAPTIASVGRRLGRRTMVEYVIDGDLLWAVVARGGRSHLVRLGELDEVRQLRDQLRSALHRAAHPGGLRDGSQPAQLASRLNDLVVAPLRLRPGDDVVIVPVADLHTVPWAGLPDLAETSFVVSASAGMWLECERRVSGPGCRTVGLVVGPDILGGGLERATFKRLYPGAAVATGSRATTRRTASLLATCDVVQLAAHGTFRPDHPLSSTVRLYDRDMSLSELAASAVNARLVVLSSCEGGAHGVSSGSELLGLGALLISRGAAAVVAPVAVVPDQICAAFVGDLHDDWSQGASIGASLGRVRQAWLQRPGAPEWAIASSFICFGSGSLTAPVTPGD